jgi:hypothetical protein
LDGKIPEIKIFAFPLPHGMGEVFPHAVGEVFPIAWGRFFNVKLPPYRSSNAER